MKICASLLFSWRQWRKAAHNSTLAPTVEGGGSTGYNPGGLGRARTVGARRVRHQLARPGFAVPFACFFGFVRIPGSFPRVPGGTFIPGVICVPGVTGFCGGSGLGGGSRGLGTATSAQRRPHGRALHADWQEPPTSSSPPSSCIPNDRITWEPLGLREEFVYRGAQNTPRSPNTPEH